MDNVCAMSLSLTSFSRGTILLMKDCENWWSRWDSNPRPPRCERDALPTELLPLNFAKQNLSRAVLEMRPKGAFLTARDFKHQKQNLSRGMLQFRPKEGIAIPRENLPQRLLYSSQKFTRPSSVKYT